MTGKRDSPTTVEGIYNWTSLLEEAEQVGPFGLRECPQQQKEMQCDLEEKSRRLNMQHLKYHFQHCSFCSCLTNTDQKVQIQKLRWY
jgi:hypothetical protein